jgi:hypothetical protein
LENFVPVGFGQSGDDGHQKGEGEIFIGFEDCEEIVIFEEAHGSICNLKMGTRDAFDKSFEEFRNKVFELGDFTHLQNLKQFSQEHNFFSRIGKWPVSEETFN